MPDSSSIQRPVAACLVGDDEVTPSGPTIPVISPWTERPVGAVAEAGADLVGRAVDVATRAHQQWRDSTPEDRASLLERVAALVERDAEQLALLVTGEMGMPITLARATQGELPARVLRSTAQVVRDFAWAEETDGAVLMHHGAGVVGAITPWNMPVYQTIAKVAAAVGAGCSVVLKPSEQTPYDAYLLASLFLEAGAPAGLFNVVTGTGPVTGAALTAHPGLARISFTGSVAAGRIVATAGAGTLTPCTLELGGKSPAVLLPDVDLDQVVASVLASGLINSGQACNATTRLVVPAALADEVEQRAAALVQEMTMGDPHDPATKLGPLVTAAHREKVLAHVADAIDDGGRLVTGTGKPSEAVEHGWFVDPTIISGLARSARAVQQEIFGPVIVVQTYSDEAEAVAVASDTAYGLSADVWSADPERATAFAAHIRAGQVKVNGVRTRHRTTVPFGGIGESGYGRELGRHGLVEMCDVTAVMR